MEIDEVERLFLTADSRVSVMERQENELLASRDKLLSLQDVLKKCGEVFSVVATERRDSLKSRLEKLLSYGLQAAFEYPLAVRVEYKKWGTGDRVQLFVDDGKTEVELQKYRGGGLTEVTSFLIRVLILSMYKPAQRRLFLGDEIFGAVNIDHLPALSKLLKELSVKLKLQIILVTQTSGLQEYADKVYVVERQNGKATFSEMN